MLNYAKLHRVRRKEHPKGAKASPGSHFYPFHTKVDRCGMHLVGRCDYYHNYRDRHDPVI